VTQTLPSKPRKERKANADRRRRQLLDAAGQSIRRHGLARTTLATVAQEAGLSQGVVVFYFKTKSGLLTETLRDLYQGYQTLWMAALDAAGDDPRDRLLAVLGADFSEGACGPKVLPLWFAYWGELRSTEEYAEVANSFDAARRSMLAGLWSDLLTDAAPGEAERLADWMDTLTDGYWQHLHVAPRTLDRKQALEATKDCIARLAPGLAGLLQGPAAR
jgi:TetR/AcrR family transcriptional repressor of bet genes